MPGSADVALYNLGANYTINFFTSPVNLKALIRNDNVTFDLGSQTYKLSSTDYPDVSLMVGQLAGDTGQLTITNGTVTSMHNMIAVQAGSKGTLNITSGGILSSTAALIVGEYGEANLNILNGGMVSNNGSGILGERSGSIGNATVDGAASSWSTKTQFIASETNSTGNLTILNGGTVTVSDNGYITYSAGSSGTVTVDGMNSAWSVAGEMRIGEAGSAIVDVRNGATVFNTYASIARNAGSTGTVNVDGAGSTWSNSMDLTLGGVVNANNALILWSPGTVNMNGGTLNIETLTFAGGVFNFNAGTLDFTAYLVLGAAGPLGSSYALNSQQNLGVAGIASIDPASVLTLDGGTFSAGTLANNGSFQFNSGTFNLTSAALTIGSGGLFGSDMQLSAEQRVNVSNSSTITGGSVLTLNNGSFSSAAIINEGDIVLTGASSRLAGTLQNNAILKGNGRVDAQTSNNSGGQIRVANGESMRFTAAGNTNAGRIEVIGGEIEFDRNLLNQSGTGNIVARDATLRFNGGLDNRGSMGLSFGTTDVSGNINNTGSVVITGNGNATFYDDYINNGVTQTSAG